MRDDIILAMAKLIWEKEITIQEFYNAMGIDIDDVGHSDPGMEISEIAGILTGWKNPPPEY